MNREYPYAGFETSSHRKNWLKRQKLSTRKYLNRKGITEYEDQIKHCMNYLEFLTGIKQKRIDFTWFKFVTLNKGFRAVFAYFTKEQVGWEGAKVPKENYKEVEEMIEDFNN